MAVSIRRLAASDSLSELTALLHAAYASLGAQGFNYTAVDQTEDATRTRIAWGECYVAEKDGHIVGTISFSDPMRSKGCPWFNRPEVSSLHQFGVLPQYQRRGVGGKLLAFVEDRARVSGAEEIALDTAEGATDLIGWYRRRGYRDVDHVQWDDKTYRSLVMSKALRR
jgi:GNAT superfamily N-acetyltransferase